MDLPDGLDALAMIVSPPPALFDIAAAARKAASVFRFSWPSLAGRMHRRGNYPTAFGQRATLGGRQGVAIIAADRFVNAGTLYGHHVLFCAGKQASARHQPNCLSSQPSQLTLSSTTWGPRKRIHSVVELN